MTAMLLRSLQSLIVQKKIASVDEGITVYACVYIRDDRYQDGITKMGFA